MAPSASARVRSLGCDEATQTPLYEARQGQRGHEGSGALRLDHPHGPATLVRRHPPEDWPPRRFRIAPQLVASLDRRRDVLEWKLEQLLLLPPAERLPHVQERRVREVREKLELHPHAVDVSQRPVRVRLVEYDHLGDPTGAAYYTRRFQCVRTTACSASCVANSTWSAKWSATHVISSTWSAARAAASTRSAARVKHVDQQQAWWVARGKQQAWWASRVTQHV
eukprot:2108254-Prymnesium_polylepis.2